MQLSQTLALETGVNKLHEIAARQELLGELGGKCIKGGL